MRKGEEYIIPKPWDEWKSQIKVFRLREKRRQKNEKEKIEEELTQTQKMFLCSRKKIYKYLF
jgi:hypothetical protein